MAIVESGLVEIWMEKHLKTKDKICDRRLSSTREKSIPLSDMTGAISILSAGLIFAFAVLLIEIAFRKLYLMTEDIIYKIFSFT